MKAMLLVIATLLAGLVAGLFYAYSCSVNPGLSRLSDSGYLSAMQSINDAILNPLFFLSFMGCLFVLPACAWAYVGTPQFPWLLGAAVLYVLAVFGVTIAGNVPLNESLSRFDIANASAQALSHRRQVFEAPWNFFHGIRTWAAVISFLLMVCACVLPFRTK